MKRNMSRADFEEPVECSCGEFYELQETRGCYDHKTLPMCDDCMEEHIATEHGNIKEEEDPEETRMIDRQLNGRSWGR